MATYRRKRVSEIFSETLGLYRRRIVPILLVALVSVLASVVLLTAGVGAAFFRLGGLEFFTGDVREILLNPAVLGSGAALFLAVILLVTWCQTAVLAVIVDQELDVAGGLAFGWKYVVSYLWIGGLYFGIVITGCILFLLPALVLALSMSLCFHIMIEEGLSGVDAISASRLYIRGRWWNTFLKFLPVCLFLLSAALIPRVGPIFFVLLMPFLLLYMSVIYRDLKGIAGEVDPNSCYSSLWVLMGMFGLLFPLLAVIGGLLVVGPRLPEEVRGIQQKINLTFGTDLFSRQSEPLPVRSLRSLPDESGGDSAPVIRQLSSVDDFPVRRDQD